MSMFTSCLCDVCVEGGRGSGWGHWYWGEADLSGAGVCVVWRAWIYPVPIFMLGNVGNERYPCLVCWCFFVLLYRESFIFVLSSLSHINWEEKRYSMPHFKRHGILFSSIYPPPYQGVLSWKPFLQAFTIFTLKNPDHKHWSLTVFNFLFSCLCRWAHLPLPLLPLTQRQLSELHRCHRRSW